MTSLDYYAIEDLLTDERAARDRTRRFVEEEVNAQDRALPSRGQISGTPQGALGCVAPL